MEKSEIDDVGPSQDRRCFLDASTTGQEAELEAYEATAEPEVLRRIIYRTLGDRTLEVLFHEAPDYVQWFRYTCTGLEPAPPGYEFETTSCTKPIALN